jgi:uncharacterized protein YndB with AHSA1/START domain
MNSDLVLSRVPVMKVGMLIRRPVHEVFEAIADPSITTKFWYTKSNGRMVEGADLVWEWEMYGVSSSVSVKTVQDDQRISFTWSGYSPENPTTVEFAFTPRQDDATYVEIRESGFTGDGDTVAW